MCVKFCVVFHNFVIKMYLFERSRWEQWGFEWFQNPLPPNISNLFHMIYFQFQLGSDIYRDFYQPVEALLDTLEHTNCGRLKSVFLKNIRRYLDLDFDNT